MKLNLVTLYFNSIWIILWFRSGIRVSGAGNCCCLFSLVGLAAYFDGPVMAFSYSCFSSFQTPKISFRCNPGVGGYCYGGRLKSRSCCPVLACMKKLDQASLSGPKVFFSTILKDSQNSSLSSLHPLLLCCNDSVCPCHFFRLISAYYCCCIVKLCFFVGDFF